MITRQREVFTDGVLVGTEDYEVPVEQDNKEAIEDAARLALDANKAYRRRPNADKNAAAVRDQVDALTRQQNGVIRLLLGLLDGTD